MTMKKRKAAGTHAPSYTCEYNKKGGITGTGGRGMVQLLPWQSWESTVSKQGQDSCQERSPAKVGTVRLPGGGGEQGICSAEALAAIPARGCSMSANNGSLSRSPFP